MLKNWISLYSILAVSYCQNTDDPPDPDGGLDVVDQSSGSQFLEPVIFCTYEGFELECFDKNGISWSPGTWLGSLFDWKLLIQARIELDITQIRTQINPDGSSSSEQEDWKESIIYDPNIPCNFTCYDEFFTQCDVDCATTIVTTPVPETTTTAITTSTTTTTAATTTTTVETTTAPTTPKRPSAIQNISKNVAEFFSKNREEVLIGSIGAGAVYAAVQALPQVLDWLNNLRFPTSAPPSVQSMRIDKTEFTYDDCLIGGNIETFSISNAPSSNFIFSLQNAKGTVDLSKVSSRQNRVNLRVSLDLVEVGQNPILQMENEDCEAPPCVLDVDIIQIDSSSSDSACSDPDVVGAFQQSLTASYLEKFFYDRVKLQFTARPANGNVTLDEAVRSIANACYKSIKDPKLVSCKVLNAVEFNPDATSSENSQSAPQTRSLFTHGPSHKITRRDVSPSDTVFSVDVVATFNGDVAGDGGDVVAIKRQIQDNVTEAVEDDDNVLQDVTQFISPNDDLAAFIVQMIVLCSSLIIGIGGAVSKVVGYCRLPGKKEEGNAVRSLVLSIFFDYLWPIIGIYPAIFVWFEYKAAEDLMYNPIPFIINLFLYFGIIKVIFFFIKVLLMDANWYERKWLENYPITVEVFLDYDIVSFLLCDAFELAVVYFYASRYMAPENQVNIANFWIPTFTFLMAFIPGMYSIFNLTRNWIKKKHEMKRKSRELKDRQREAVENGVDINEMPDNASIHSDSSDIQKLDKKANRFKFIVAIISEVLGVITLCLTLLLFLCSTAVTLCVTSNEIVADPRENSIAEDGSLIQKENFWTDAKAQVELPGFCKILPKQWFNQRESRFDEACLEHKLESGTPSTIPHPFMKCSNPLEVIAAIAICVSMVLQIVILIIFVSVRYGQKMKRKELKVYHKKKAGRQSRYRLNNAKTKEKGILEHKESSIHGTYSAKDLHIAFPANFAMQEDNFDNVN